jgi:alginate O-acetyltransferase complex protein AlgI
MIFNTPEYYLLLLVSALGFRVLTGAARLWLLVLAGAVFFVWFSVTAVGGWAGALCLGLFLWEAAFSRLYREGSRWCLTGVGLALVILFAFKYWNFGVGMVGLSEFRWSGAFLPLGISFFTFEFIHYAVDRWRGKTERGTFLEYLSFILFFPTMVAGPIKRFQDWLVALRVPSQDISGDWLHGITRILAGLAKKLAIADLLTAFTDHLNAADVAVAPRWTLLLWIFAYGIKIYADFSAYSDIAIGSARLFGLRVKENFDWPYLQRNIAEFWTHWHISLYRWLVDYLFIPLGGSRVRLPLICRNILLTMLVSGLWHGASMNFVVWGLYHGLLLVTHRLWRTWRPLIGEPPAWKSIASTALTLISVNLGWAFFAMDLETALLWVRRVLLG